MAREGFSLSQKLKQHAPKSITIEEEVAEVVSEMHGYMNPECPPNDGLARATVLLSRACDEVTSEARTAENMYDNRALCKELENIHDSIFDVGTRLRTAYKKQIDTKRRWLEKSRSKREK